MRIPAGQHASYRDLAETAAVPESQLRRITRMAMSASFLRESPPDCLSHTRLSTAFAEPSLCEWLAFVTGASIPTAMKLVQATKSATDPSVKRRSAYSIAMDTELSFFEHLRAEKNIGQQFAGYMKHLSRSRGTALKHIVHGYDWSSLGQVHVVDVRESLIFPSLFVCVKVVAD